MGLKKRSCIQKQAINNTNNQILSHIQTQKKMNTINYIKTK